MRELTAGAVHTDLVLVERAALGHFVPGRDVRLLLDLVVAVGKGTAVPEATHAIQPVFANLSLLLDSKLRF